MTVKLLLFFLLVASVTGMRGEEDEKEEEYEEISKRHSSERRREHFMETMRQATIEQFERIQQFADRLLQQVRNVHDFRKLRRKHEFVVALFNPSLDTSSVTHWLNTGLMVGIALLKNTVAAAIINPELDDLTEFSKKEVGPRSHGVVKIYYGGNSYFFRGYRNDLILFYFIERIRTFDVTLITERRSANFTKSTSFEKVVGYFSKAEDQDYFKAASRTLGPDVKMFLIGRQEVAKAFRMKKDKSIVYFGVGDKIGQIFGNMKSAKDIVEVVTKERASRKAVPLSVGNINYFAIESPHSPLLLAVVDSNTDEGMHFLSLSKAFAKKPKRRPYVFAWLNAAEPAPSNILLWMKNLTWNLSPGKIGLVPSFVDFHNATDSRLWFSAEGLDLSDEKNIGKLLDEWLVKAEEFGGHALMNSDQSQEEKLLK